MLGHWLAAAHGKYGVGANVVDLAHQQFRPLGDYTPHIRDLNVHFYYYHIPHFAPQISCWLSIPKASTSANSTNCELKIFSKKFQNVPKGKT